MTEVLTTPLTKLFGIKHPILLAGMNVAAGPELAATVTNCGLHFCVFRRVSLCVHVTHVTEAAFVVQAVWV